MPADWLDARRFQTIRNEVSGVPYCGIDSGRHLCPCLRRDANRCTPAQCAILTSGNPALPRSTTGCMTKYASSRCWPAPSSCRRSPWAMTRAGLAGGLHLAGHDCGGTLVYRSLVGDDLQLGAVIFRFRQRNAAYCQCRRSRLNPSALLRRLIELLEIAVARIRWRHDDRRR